MTDFYGVSGRTAAPEYEPMSEAECERKIALLRACWATFDDVASRVSPELRQGPRGGGRDRDRIVRHVNGAEIDEFAVRVGVATPLDAREDPAALRAHRDALAPPSVTTTPEASPRGPGPSSSCSDVARITCWTTPGRWRTGTSATRPDRTASRARLWGRSPPLP